MKYPGSCHCGAIQFLVDAGETINCKQCNCSICRQSGFLHLIVPRSKFTLMQGAKNLTTYTWGTGVAQHLFCKTCGIKAFYIPRSNPNGYDINVNCLDTKPSNIIINEFDGINWEDNAHKLTHLSQE